MSKNTPEFNGERIIHTIKCPVCSHPLRVAGEEIIYGTFEGEDEPWTYRRLFIDGCMNCSNLIHATIDVPGPEDFEFEALRIDYKKLANYFESLSKD